MAATGRRVPRPLKEKLEIRFPPEWRPVSRGETVIPPDSRCSIALRTSQVQNGAGKNLDKSKRTHQQDAGPASAGAPFSRAMEPVPNSGDAERTAAAHTAKANTSPAPADAAEQAPPIAPSLSAELPSAMDRIHAAASTILARGVTRDELCSILELAEREDDGYTADKLASLLELKAKVGKRLREITGLKKLICENLRRFAPKQESDDNASRPVRKCATARRGKRKPAPEPLPYTAEEMERMQNQVVQLHRQLADDQGVYLAAPSEDLIRRVLKAAKGHPLAEIDTAFRHFFINNKLRSARSWGLLLHLTADWFPRKYAVDGASTESARVKQLKSSEPLPSVVPEALTIPAEDPKSAWAAIKADLKSTMALAEYGNWIEPTVQGSVNDGELVVIAPDEITVQGIVQEYATTINQAVIAHGFHGVRFEVARPGPAAKGTARQAKEGREFTKRWKAAFARH